MEHERSAARRSSWEQTMRDDWDERVRGDLRYICWNDDGWNTDGDLGAFYEEGKAHAITLTSPALERSSFRASGKRMLELGCGIGRLFPGFHALGFGEIWGVDVSPTMIERGLALCRIREAKFVLGNGYDLSGLPDGYFDFCFSYNVLGYVPNDQIALGYLPELYRVLKPGGLFQLHLRKSIPLKARTLIALPGAIRPHVRAAYHAVSRISERLRRRPDARATVKQPTAFLGNLKTWHGATLSPRRVVRRLGELGCVEIDVLADESPRTDGSFFWVLGQKSRRVMIQVGPAIPRLPLGKPGTVGSV